MLRRGLKFVPLVAFTSAISTNLALASSQAPDVSDEVQSEIVAVRREKVEKKWYVRMFLEISSRADVSLTLTLSRSRTHMYIRKQHIRMTTSMDVARRLAKHGYPADPRKNKNITLEWEEGGVKYYYVKRAQQGRFGKEGLTHARVAVAEVAMSVDECADAWGDQGGRVDWDSQVSYSAVLEQLGDGLSLVRSKGVAGWAVPARDFVFYSWKTSGAAAGLRNFSSAAVINADARDDAPQHWNSVRGMQNSMMVFEPRGSRTQVTYIAELSYGGWLWSMWVDMYAGRFMRSLAALKKNLEGDDDDETAGATVEDIARRRFEKRKHKKDSVAAKFNEDVPMERAEVLATLAMLEKRLVDIKATERADGLDLQELRKRVQDDITQANMRLRDLD